MKDLSTINSLFPLESPRIRLREVVPSDYGFLYKLASSPELSWSWRYRSRQIGFERFVQTMRDGVLVHFTITMNDHSGQIEGRPIGQVICYNADMHNRHAYVAVQGHPHFFRSGATIDAARLFIQYVFALFDFRKIYIECPEFVLDSHYKSITRLFREEARYVDHEFFAGSWWDLLVYAIDRSTWNDRVARLYNSLEA
jgi:RimJ/RimL family protein N-acetyltransferase